MANAKREIAQLHATSRALREEIERAPIVHAAAVEAIQAQHRAEIAQLQATVRELRAKLQLLNAALTRGAG